MKLNQYKKYRIYTLLMIPVAVVFYSFSEQKNDIFYSIGVSLIFLIMILGNWLNILIKKEMGLSITLRDNLHLAIPLIVGVPYIFILFMKVKL